jgi:DNA-binding MarR family transcriptional regulator
MVASDNIRSLLQVLSQQLDQRIAHFQIGTPYEHVRMSDVKVFVTAARVPRSIAQIARDFGVSRQAVQSSVQRLIGIGVVELLDHPDSQRDKIVSVTAHGSEARAQAIKHIALLEKECADILGPRGLEQFRAQLLALTTGLTARQMTDNVDGRAEAVA